MLVDPVTDGIVALILAEHEEERAALAISSFAEAAHFPASLWVSIPKTTHIHSLIKLSRRFSVVVLTEEQRELARQFGSEESGGTHEVTQLDTYRSERGFQFLNGAIASTACTVKDEIDLQSHTLFLADILEAEIDSRQSHRRQLLASELGTA